MTAAKIPLSESTGGRNRRVPTHLEIERHLLGKFNLTRSAARRIARCAVDVRNVRPEVDAIRWAEADHVRRQALVGVPLLLRGFDPTPINAERNMAATAVTA